MHLKAPVGREGTPDDDDARPGTGVTPPVTPSSRSPSVDLAEMDNIVSTQDDVVRRYVGLRDGLQVLEREVSYIRNLNSGTGHRSHPVSVEHLSSEEEEDIDR